MKQSKENKTPDWDLNDLKEALKDLKKNKASDALGHINELYKPQVAGSDLKLALLKLMNNIKQQQIFPHALEACNITSIFKNKGSKTDFDNYRGIFRVIILRSILERLIYNDEYTNIDENLTDANVGARKKRNIRDNLFVINAIMNSAKRGVKEALDVCAYDAEKCFDALWTYECVNDLYEAGLQNDKLSLLFEINQVAQVAIKTPHGMTKRVTIPNIIMQGTVWGSLNCTTTMDKFAKKVYNNDELLYKYRGEVSVPPLQMVDDILTVQKCGSTSSAMNDQVNAFIEQKKLKLSVKKCVKIHIGAKCKECEKLLIHKEDMKEAHEVKYLGDMINDNGRPNSTILKRITRGYAIVGTIFAFLNDLPLGNKRIQVGLELRQAWLKNGILFNSEVWHSVSNTQIENLMAIDKYLLRGLIGAHAKVPLEHLYLELAALPLSYVISARRMIYLQTILKRSDEEVTKQVYKCQKKSPVPGDWCNLLKEDFDKINMHLTDEQIEEMPEKDYKRLIRLKTREAAFVYLQSLKESHDKVMINEYMDMKSPQSYITSRSLTNTEKSILFALRSQSIRGIKMNFPNMYSENSLCPMCERSPDTQQHLPVCTVLTNILPNKKHMDYTHINGSLEEQRDYVQVYKCYLELRDELIESSDSACLPGLHTGPMRPLAASRG